MPTEAIAWLGGRHRQKLRSEYMKERRGEAIVASGLQKLHIDTLERPNAV
jgi:hypothetical protein